MCRLSEGNLNTVCGDRLSNIFLIDGIRNEVNPNMKSVHDYPFSNRRPKVFSVNYFERCPVL